MTAGVATVRRDGRAHAAPVWFTLDGDDLVFTTGADTVKGRGLRRTGRAAVVVDDPSPPFGFVSLEGPVTVSEVLDEVLTWTTRISARYVGAEAAEAFGRRTTIPGTLLVRVTPETVAAIADLTD